MSFDGFLKQVNRHKAPIISIGLWLGLTISGRYAVDHLQKKSIEEKTPKSPIKQYKTRKFVLTPKPQRKKKIQKKTEIEIESKEEKKNVFYRGIINEGATCYLSSVIQTFFHLNIFREVVFHTPSKRSPSNMTYQLKKCFYELQSKSNLPSNIDEFISIRSLTRSFGWSDRDMYVQHDINELITIFLESIENKIKRSKSKGFDNFLSFLFRIKQKNVIKAEEDNFRSETFDTLLTLRLTVEKNLFGDGDDLNSSLNRYFKPTLLHGENKYRLPNGKYVNAKKMTFFSRLPPVLMVQLERINYNGIYLSKNHGRFEYPEFLSLPINGSKKLSKVDYELFFVIVHIGVGKDSGHYFNFVKKNGKWWKFNDEKVSKVSSYDAIDANFGGEWEMQSAYMLIYCKKDLTHKIFKEVKIPKEVEKEFSPQNDSNCIVM